MEKQIATISMTGFAAAQGSGQGYDWSWDIRSVNGKALDLRLRLPDVEGLEPFVRAAVGQFAARGNISANLRLTRVDAAEGLRLSGSGMRAALAALREIESVATTEGMALAQTTAADVLTLRGVLEQGPAQMDDPSALRAALIASLEGALAKFAAMRAAEGAQIGAVIAAQLTRIAELTEAAAKAAEARRPDWEAGITAALARVVEGAGGADRDRVAQELALIAVKGDVTEEIDRLRAHIAAARDLLADPKPVGRRFDFLTQEFVREANTLCSKSGSSRLTAIGLDLKHVIDQMREQIQNVE
ncbi:YicC family protein [Sinirhodobacter sp. WL0062]|uniref:YicC family protein n=1 Tax=Rhodobacter flavimaris TaxID=2907145 RepID=A0ABS8YQQ9_9RHOB|nr:YicC/YloC family endoribonuclease [Sinirhodobacter sp. WL0062]MCE5972226.1 YicC family protein [Sinirhodobacter sp. WL0062]